MLCRQKTHSASPGEHADSVPLRRSARLIAKRQRLEEGEAVKNVQAGQKASSHSNRSSTRARSIRSSTNSVVKEVRVKVPTIAERSSTVSYTEGKTPTRAGSRKRKRSSSPKHSPVSEPSEPPNVRSKTSTRTRPPSSRSIRSRTATKKSSESPQAPEELETDSVTGTSETEVKTKASAKRRRAARGTSTSTSSVVATSTGGRSPSSSRGFTKAEKLESSTHYRSGGKSGKESLSVKYKRKGKTKRNQLSSSVEGLDEGPKRAKRRKEQSKGEGETSEGEFDRHGRRITGKSVICDPTVHKGKGKSSTEKSAKGKGRARAEVSRYNVQYASRKRFYYRSVPFFENRTERNRTVW